MSAKSTIAIRYAGDAKTVNVTAEIHGLLAINQAVNHEGIEIKGSWTITHVPTGWAVLQPLTFSEARIAIKDLCILKWPRSAKPLVAKKRTDLRDAVLAMNIRIQLARGGVK